MTAVGKILVFLNLVFSIVVIGLIATVYSTRTNWKNLADKNAAYVKTAKAAYLASQQALEAQKKSFEEQLVAKDEQIKSQENLLSIRKKEIDDLQKQFAEKDKSYNDEMAKYKEVERTKDLLNRERENLANKEKEQKAQIDELLKDNDNLRRAQIAAEQRAKLSESKLTRLADRVAELEVALKAAKEGNRALMANNLVGTRQPIDPPVIASPAPQQNVRGTVLYVRDSGLTQISIGSDHGLAKGNVLTVMRLVPENPKESKYLGTLTISQTEPKSAVGQFVPVNRYSQPRPGDEVMYTPELR